MTLEATFFLDTLEKVSRQNQIQLDPHLTQLFERIVVGIEKYLDKNPTFIVQQSQQVVNEQQSAAGSATGSKGVSFVQPKELLKIKRTFNCSDCTNRIVGTTISKAVMHLAEQHPNPNPNPNPNLNSNNISNNGQRTKTTRTKQERKIAEVEARSKMTMTMPKSKYSEDIL